MSKSLSDEGRLKAFRLSDVPLKVRMGAALKCADDEIRNATDPMMAVFEATKLRRVAEDPELAALTMPEECGNEPHMVTWEEWERALNPRRWTRL